MTTSKRRPSGSTIGAILVGFDQEVFRTLPPAQELVATSRPVRGISGRAPGLEITFPDDLVIDADTSLAAGSSEPADQPDEGAPEA